MEEKLISKEKEVNAYKVSIIITTFKRPSYLIRAVDSCLNQSYDNLEVIIVDDNNDNSLGRKETEQVMQKFTDHPKVKYIKHKVNSNGAVARNTGIANASGDYITFLDDDDYYRKNKVSRQIDYISEFNLDAVYCGWTREGKSTVSKKDGDLSYEILSGSHLVYTNAIMIRTEVSNFIGNWDESFSRNQEAAYLLRYFAHGFEIGSVPEDLIVFDTTDRGNASNPQKNQEDFEYFLEVHKDQIESISLKCPKKGKLIYVVRYRGVILSYLKNRDIKSGIAAYIKYIREYPVLLNVEMLKYIVYRLVKRDLFDEK